MSQDLVVETVRDILGGFEPFALTAERRWDAGLWAALAESGLTGVGLPEEAGGSGGELADAVAVVRTVAAGAGAVPLAEHLLVAAPVLLAADIHLPPVEQPLTFAVADAVTTEAVDDGDGPGRFLLTGTATDVAWAGVGSSVVLLATPPAGLDGGLLALVDASDLPATDAVNLAGEPRGSLVLDAVPAVGATVLHDAQALALRARFALARAVQLAAALEQVLAWTVQYAGEREQFGRPLGKFQAIQMELAEMAGEVTAVTALTDAAGTTMFMYTPRGELDFMTVGLNGLDVNYEWNDAGDLSKITYEGGLTSTEADTDRTFDYDRYIKEVQLGKGTKRTMALPDMFFGYDKNVKMYSYDPKLAAAFFRKAFGGQLWENGFVLKASYRAGSVVAQTAMEMLKASVEKLNPKFKIELTAKPWSEFLSSSRQSKEAMIILGWAPDYADPDNFIYTFYHSDGFYKPRLNFSDRVMDGLIEQARQTTDRAKRQALYSQVGNRGYELAPFILVPAGVGFLVYNDKIKGLEENYNIMLSGGYFWKDISK